MAGKCVIVSHMTASCHIYERAPGSMHQGAAIVPHKRNGVTTQCRPTKKKCKGKYMNEPVSSSRADASRHRHYPTHTQKVSIFTVTYTQKEESCRKLCCRVDASRDRQENHSLSPSKKKNRASWAMLELLVNKNMWVVRTRRESAKMKGPSIYYIGAPLRKNTP